MTRLRHLGLGLVLGLAGCAGTARQVSGGAIEGSVSTIAQPENLERIDTITSSPEFQNSIERVGRSMVRGVTSGVDVDVDELAKSTEEVGAALGRGLARGFREGLGNMPEPGAMIDDAITSALTTASSEANQERARSVITNVTGTLVRTALASAAEGLDQDLDPVLDRASGTAAPRLARILSDEELRGALGGMFQEVSRNATLGFDRGMEQVRQSNREEQEGILGRGALISVIVSAVVLLLAAIIAIIVLGVANSRRRHEREDMLTSMLITFAGHGAGIDEATRAELLRHLGVSGPAMPALKREAPRDSGSSGGGDGVGLGSPSPGLQ